MRKTIVGIMGPGSGAKAEDLALAEELGRLVAECGWMLVTGGRSEGVMEAASRAAKKAGGQTIGILPFSYFDSDEVSSWIDFPILTGIGEARNLINVLTSQVVIVCGMSSGTASEVALALKTKRPVVLVAPLHDTEAFFRSLGEPISVAKNAKEAIDLVVNLLP